jgi:hypothetical protein
MVTLAQRAQHTHPFHETYGSPRVVRDIRENGFVVVINIPSRRVVPTFSEHPLIC